MKPLAPLVALLGILTACQADSPTELATTGPELRVESGGLTAQEQGIVDALKAGEDPGAIIDRGVPCGMLTGFSNDGAMVAFGGLFPTEGPQGICPLSNFARTNPDGSVDVHVQGAGGFFLVVFSAGVYPSTGSHVRWRAFTNENGIQIFTITGTLSDGSQVRAQFVTTPGGTNVAANMLWIEGVGYVVGGPAS